MRYLFLFLAFVGFAGLTPLATQAQSGSTTIHGRIEWGGYTDVPARDGGRKQRVPTFSGATHERGQQAGSFGVRIEGIVAQGELLNLRYESFSAADARLFDLGKLPAGPEPRLMQGTEMKLPVTQLGLYAVRRNAQTGQPEKLISFDYQYTAGSLAARGTQTGRDHAAHSVLASGQWYKIGVPASGIYKVDYALLRSLGMSPQSLDPRLLRLYGNSVGILPQLNSAYRPDDLVENAVRFVGDADGEFEDGEYLLFYSPGPHTWEASGGVFRHRNNVYCDTAYYFLTAGSTAGLRVAPAPAPGVASSATITTFTDRFFHEHDLQNLLRSGRNWVGEGFSGSTPQTFSFGPVADLVPNAPVRLTSSVVGAGFVPTSFQLALNGASVGTQSMGARSTQSYTAVGHIAINSYTVPLPANSGPDLRVALTFNNSGDGTASGYLDYLELNVLRRLRLSGTQLEFRSLSNIAPATASRFVLGNAANATVWDVTNPRRARAYALDAGGGFEAVTDSLREFVAFNPNGAFQTPRPFGRVGNSDLHSLNNDGQLDLVIVTYPPFKAAAQRLADHRTRHDNLRVAVVTTTEVYNEYSSGGQDVTAIRDLMKQVYDRAPAGKFIQLLLFGDASYDYKSSAFNDKNFEPAWWANRTPFSSSTNFDAKNQNFVPTYESRESLAPFYGGYFGQASYSSDDYFALLDDDEGEWAEQQPHTELLDAGVGRLPVRTEEGLPRDATQAGKVVDKIISYDGVAAYGKWRNRVTLVTDDGEGELFYGNSEAVTDTIKKNYPAYNVHKVYLDLYPQISVAAGQRSPEAMRAIDESIEQGSLLVNYLGHGGPKGWADEQILTNATVTALRNADNLPFMVTGTCDFSTYDNPDFTSAGEEILTDNTNGGAVGLFTTTRVVEANENAKLNEAFFKRLFTPINGQMPRISQVVMLAKNSSPTPGTAGRTDTNNRNYVLLADPSMRLAYPRQQMVIDSVNKTLVINADTIKSDTIKAQARVRLSGRVLNGGALNQSFNGTAQITIYDKPTTQMTLGDEAHGSTTYNAPRPVKVQETVIFGGAARVVNGRYDVSFVVPKDINYNLGLGKVSLYAQNNTDRVDAHGSQYVPVGGVDRTAPRDTVPPQIRLYMDTESFVYGGLTAQNTTMLARLTDASGINTTGTGIGHDMTVTLDRDPSTLVVVNNSYVTEVDNFTAGKVDYLFKDLKAGPHTLTFKAWDTHNNSAESELEFIVANNEKLALEHVLNYPNPFANVTTFHFDHNHPGDDLDVQVQIFTVSGKLVRTLSAVVPGSESHQKSISWNGRDDYDDQLARGVYVYRLSVRVRSPNNGSVASKYEKLVILN